MEGGSNGWVRGEGRSAMQADSVCVMSSSLWNTTAQPAQPGAAPPGAAAGWWSQSGPPASAPVIVPRFAAVTPGWNVMFYRFGELWGVCVFTAPNWNQ